MEGDFEQKGGWSAGLRRVVWERCVVLKVLPLWTSLLLSGSASRTEACAYMWADSNDNLHASAGTKVFYVKSHKWLHSLRTRKPQFTCHFMPISDEILDPDRWVIRRVEMELLNTDKHGGRPRADKRSPLCHSSVQPHQSLKVVVSH